MRRAFALLAILLILSPRCLLAEPTDAQLAHFEEHIRPILAGRCYECHSGSDVALSGNLRLDYDGGWLEGGDSGPVIDLDNPDASRVLRAISYEDPDLQMPPRSKLPAREIELLREWIRSGAPAPHEDPPTSDKKAEGIDMAARRASHWAWQPVERPELPPVADINWPRDDIDRFILARLEAVGLAPSDEVDPAAWLRRVTFDLTGLPPTREEIHEFLANPDEAARERVVDRLLASRAFAECWAQHWLDMMRFAETKGHEGDYEVPHAWRYRDYVIRAYEANVPHDDFIVEHIAGDLLPSPRIDPETRTNQSIQGTGFWHMGEATHSPVDIRGEEAERIDNQIDVFGKAFLGLTVACARCHDHKFDAIGTDDYYALCGFLQSSGYQEANVSDPELHEQIVAQLRDFHTETEHELFGRYRDSAINVMPQFEQMLGDVIAGADGPLADELATAGKDPAHPLRPLYLATQTADASQSQAELTAYIDESEAVDPPFAGEVVVDFRDVESPPSYDDWRTGGWLFGDTPSQAGSIRLGPDAEHPIARIVEAPGASSSTLSTRLTGLYRTRTFAVTQPSVWYLYRGSASGFLDVDSHRTLAGPLHGVCRANLEQADQPKWYRQNTEDYIGHRVYAEFKPNGDFQLLAVVVAKDEPPLPKPRPNRIVAHAIVDQAAETPAQVATAITTAMRQSLEAVEQGSATSDDAKLVNWLLANDELLGIDKSSVQAAAARYFEQRAAIEAKIPSPQWALALLDGSGEDEHIHIRGSHKNVAPQTTPRRFLTALGGGFDIPHGSGRLELARHVVDPSNPLPSRVHVNRVWAYLTGRGIVRSVDNLGVLGDPPTHPELLDYLADEFVASGWDTKALIRRVVLSRTYRQGCTVSDTAKEIDPANLLLHSARVRRISGEAIRDSLLAVAGQLKDEPYGPSVPVQITDFMRHNRSPGGSGPMDGNCRRSIYIEVRRNALNHFLTAFDRPLPFTTVGLRHVSNSPAQPLTMLNDPLVFHFTGAWAEQLVATYPTDEAAIETAYLTAFARDVSPAEKQNILDFVSDSDDRLQAWRDVCLALVNSKEFVFLR